MHLPRLIRRKVALLFGLAFMFSAMPAYTQTYQRSFYKMTTGNGHGFQVFDRQAGSITSFLEHPYLFIAPFDNARDGGLERRNLTYKTYFGLTVNGQTQWLENLQNVQYEAQTHIIKATTTVNGADVEVRYFGPFGLEANGMVMAIRVKNSTDSDMAVTTFAKPNMKLGQWSDSRRRPGDNGERLEWNGRYGIETGPAGGHMIYLPIDGADSAWCGLDLALADAVVAGNQDNGMFICPDNLSTAMPRNDQVLVTAKDGTIAPGESMWWGQAVLFVNDNQRPPG